MQKRRRIEGNSDPVSIKAFKKFNTLKWPDRYPFTGQQDPLTTDVKTDL